MTYQYEPINNEVTFEKVSIYVDSNERPAHASRQLSSGHWTSKLGQSEDIEHVTLNELSGSIYGNIAVVLKRQKIKNQN